MLHQTLSIDSIYFESTDGRLVVYDDNIELLAYGDHTSLQILHITGSNISYQKRKIHINNMDAVCDDISLTLQQPEGVFDTLYVNGDVFRSTAIAVETPVLLPLPLHRKCEYFAQAPDGTRILVTDHMYTPPGEEPYEGWRVFVGKGTQLDQVEIVQPLLHGISRLRDGGTTTIQTSAGVFHQEWNGPKTMTWCSVECIQLPKPGFSELDGRVHLIE